MVEISGQTGIFKEIGMRFIGLKNSIGADVFTPNRTITNVVSFPHGYVRCFLDVRLPNQEGLVPKMENCVKNLCLAAYEQYSGIFVSETHIEGRLKTSRAMAASFLELSFAFGPE
jgi:hypothetical protein